MNEKEFKWAIPANGQSKRILEHLYTLNSIQEKIAYLTKEVVFFKQKAINLGRNYPSDIKFAIEFCELEISKLKEERELEKMMAEIQEPKEESAKGKTKDTQKHKDLTLDRAVLVFNYLFKFAQVNSHNTEKSEFISFLTGFSKETIRQRLSNLHEKENNNRNLWEKDLKIVRKYFESLGLTEIVKMIDNELSM